MGQEDDVVESSSDDDRKKLNRMTETEKEETVKLVSVAKGGGGTSIAERRAAKCGFNAERINTARFRTTNSLARSPPPCLTIPPGISPTALLDSPIMLPNYQALPSPTTGTFPLPCFNQESSTLNSDGDKGRDMASTFQFNPNYGHTKSSPVCSSSENQGASFDYHDLVFEQSPMDFQFPEEFPGKTTSKYYAADRLSTDTKVSNNKGRNPNSVNLQTYQTDHVINEKTSHYSRQPNHHEEDNETTNQVLEGSQPNSYQSLTGMGRTSEDGYNWRKYGQKQVKGSECPRSYYKCTNPNCQVKKKVERSHDGQITEIIYKGAHNHAKPPPNRRAVVGSSFSSDHEMSAETGDNSTGTYVKVEGGSAWMNFQSAATDHMKLGSDIGLERTSSTSVVTELSDPLSAHGVSLGVFESTETLELSSTLASHDDDDEDGATQGSNLLGDDDKESDSKRRKTESCLIETNLASRAVREPRVVVQIESDVDILDDGYRWRKYGQKVVKGNPNPRSYYKCTSAGCTVRKHVERASHNLKFVITTYEGKHNHEVPAAKNSSHINSSTSNGPPLGVANAPQTLTLPRNSVIPKHEMEDLAPQFDRKIDFSNEYFRPSFPGNFSNDIKYGVSSIYQMKFPLQGSIPFNPFGLNLNSNATQQAASIEQLDFPMMPMSLPALVGFDFNNAKSVSSIQSLLSGQQLHENDMRILRPKQEQEDDNLYDACLPIHELANPSSVPSPSSSMHYRLMGSFPS